MSSNTWRNILQAQERAFRRIVERVWSSPAIGETVRFIYQELGEADSLIMRLFDGEGFFRSRKTTGRVEEFYNLHVELGQSLIMLLTAMSQTGIDANAAMARAIAHTVRKLHRAGKISLFDCSEISAITNALHPAEFELVSPPQLKDWDDGTCPICGRATEPDLGYCDMCLDHVPHACSSLNISEDIEAQRVQRDQTIWLCENCGQSWQGEYARGPVACCKNPKPIANV